MDAGEVVLAMSLLLVSLVLGAVDVAAEDLLTAVTEGVEAV